MKRIIVGLQTCLILSSLDQSVSLLRGIKRLALLLATMIGFAVGVERTSAATYYIAPGGSDTIGDGTIGNPYFSFEKIHDDIGLNPGDTIYARGGTYNWVGSDGNRDGMRWTAQGTTAKPITVMAYPGETPIFDGGSAGWDKVFVRVFNGDHVVFDGLEITNYLNGFSLNCDVYKACTDNLEDFTIRNNYIHDTSEHSIYIRTGTENIKIYNNFIEDPGGHKNGIHTIFHNDDRKYGIHVWHGPGPVGMEIYNNVIVDSYVGIELSENTTDANIYNNTFYDNHFGVSILRGEPSTGGQGVTNVAIRNNIFYMTQANPVRQDGRRWGYDFGIYVQSNYDTDDLVNDNNLFYNDRGPGARLFLWGSAGSITLADYVSQTTNGDNSVEMDPVFTMLGPTIHPTRANTDLTLQSTSPAIDLGRSPLVASTDFAGNNRPQGSDFDIGAYEYVVVPEPTALGLTGFLIFIILAKAETLSSRKIGRNYRT